MKVTDDQMKFIQEDIQNKGIELRSIADSIVDHVCCALENHKGTDFNKVYDEIICSFGKDGLQNIQEETLLLLIKKKEEKMKKAMYLIGFVAAFLSTTGLLFNFQHWPGAAIVLTLGIVLLNFGFLPIYFYDRYKSATK